MSQFLLTLTCRDCGERFEVSVADYTAMGLNQLPRRCPKCSDVKQARPQVALDRRDLWSTDVRVGHSVLCLLQSAQPFQPTPRDLPAWRVTVKGSRYGASWQGRLDLYLHGVEPTAVEAGQLVRLAHREVKHRVWLLRWERQTMEHGVVSGYRRVAPETEGAVEREETSQYVTILPAIGTEPVGTLVWAEAHTKTTLKGFGRQYWARLEGTPLWSLSIHGAGRTGRFHTDAMLAVVEEGNPLIHVFEEGGEVTRTLIAD